MLKYRIVYNDLMSIKKKIRKFIISWYRRPGRCRTGFYRKTKSQVTTSATHACAQRELPDSRDLSPSHRLRIFPIIIECSGNSPITGIIFETRERRPKNRVRKFWAKKKKLKIKRNKRHAIVIIYGWLQNVASRCEIIIIAGRGVTIEL